MSYAAVSSFSLHRVLGPLSLETRGEDGSLQPFEMPFPKEHSLEEFGALARERLGVEAIELCQIQFDSTDDARIHTLRAALDAAGVRLLTLPIDIGDLNALSDALRAEDVARIKPWFETARRLGASYVRVNAGSPISAGSSVAYDGLVAALKELAAHAQGLGLKLLVENHGGPSSDPDFVLRLRDDVGPDNLGILLDLGNFEPIVSVSHGRLLGGDPESVGLDTEPVYASIARLAPVATLVHAKAIDPAADGTPLLDLPRALGIVADAGYAGSVSVEWEGQLGDPWVQTGKVLEAVRTAFPALA